MTCADCSCVVDRGVRLETCEDLGCCCRALVTQARLDEGAATLRQNLNEGDLSGLVGLLSGDVHWGDDGSPNA